MQERPLIHECLPEVFPSYFRCRIGDLMGSVKKLFIEAGWEVGGEGHSLVTRPITQIWHASGIDKSDPGAQHRKLSR